MISREIIDDYLRRSGDEEMKFDGLIYEEGKGFLSFRVVDGNLVCRGCYGDGKYWDALMEKIKKERGLKKTIIATRRNPRAFERKYGYKLTGYILEK